MKTLFVVGSPIVKDILTIASKHDIKHIYLGANKSFSEKIFPFILKYAVEDLTHLGYYVTIDLNIRDLELIRHIEVISKNVNVFLNVSVEIPHIEDYQNLSIKIDDDDFESTNPGVWVFSVNDLNKDTFNNWDVYKSDKIIGVI